ncbi:MAG: NADH-quinone oxidoreductase subunit K [Gemmatimonadota bacterium]
MSAALLYPLVGAAVFAIGLFGLLARAELVAKVLSFNVMSTGASLVLVGLARSGASGLDPVPQALVLTGIVVTVSATAVALALIVRLRQAEREEVPTPTESRLP